ncbi:MAG TPA: Ada metal-binding domain-containing protein [Cyclobacteriaceae bacterium]|nr:Ada metal-binding domain-containing protein [Cyclobacteriaceae bacterium]
MTRHDDISNKELIKKIRKGEIQLAGNARLKIFGTLQCPSGKRMFKKNRVFFSDYLEATKHGFRPCGHCMREAYQLWKERHQRNE